MVKFVKEIVYPNATTIACFGDLRVNKVSISFFQQLDLKNKNKT